MQKNVRIVINLGVMRLPPAVRPRNSAKCLLLLDNDVWCGDAYFCDADRQHLTDFCSIAVDHLTDADYWDVSA